jgi:hypothetical protein
MQSKVFSWHSLYLRWAGLVSACLGLFSSILLVLAYQETAPTAKLYLGVAGFIGALFGYAIAKDITDRFRNHEDGTDLLPNQQARFAYIGTRFVFALSKLILFFALVSTAVFLLSPIERAVFFCSNQTDWRLCIHEATGIPFE